MLKTQADTYGFKNILCLIFLLQSLRFTDYLKQQMQIKFLQLLKNISFCC